MTLSTGIIDRNGKEILFGSHLQFYNPKDMRQTYRGYAEPLEKNPSGIGFRARVMWIRGNEVHFGWAVYDDQNDTVCENCEIIE